MIPPSRESISLALFGLISRRIAVAYPYMSTSRKLVMASEVDEMQQPALFFRDHDEIINNKGRSLPAKRTFKYFLVIYAKKESLEEPGAATVNPILDAVEACLAPDNVLVDTVTLQVGGINLAYQCQINGQIIKETGDTDPRGQCMLIIPVELISE
jgi:hypothetical protein